jgi:hypothetical protein
VTQMGRLRWGADCEGVLVLVAEGDLSLVPAASMLFFVPTLFRLAVGGMPDVVVAGFADVGALPACSGLPTPLPLLPSLPTLFELDECCVVGAHQLLQKKRGPDPLLAWFPFLASSGFHNADPTCFL